MPEVLTRAPHCCFTAPQLMQLWKHPSSSKAIFLFPHFPFTWSHHCHCYHIPSLLLRHAAGRHFARVTTNEWGHSQLCGVVLPDRHLAEVQLSVDLPTVTHRAPGCISQSRHSQSWQHGATRSSDQVLGLTNWLLFYSILWTGKEKTNIQKDKMGGAEEQIYRQIIYHFHRRSIQKLNKMK